MMSDSLLSNEIPVADRVRFLSTAVLKLWLHLENVGWQRLSVRLPHLHCPSEISIFFKNVKNQDSPPKNEKLESDLFNRRATHLAS